MKKRILILTALATAIVLTSCQKYLDINHDPDNIIEAQAPMDLLLTNVTANVSFHSASDVYKYAALLMQQLSGQSTSSAENQTQSWERYLIQSGDVSNQWSAFYATIQYDIANIIAQAKAKNAPYYGGVAKLMQVYVYQLVVDAWGNVPYSQANGGAGNPSPKYDDGAAIYTSLLATIDDALNDLNQPSSSLSPGANSTIYTGSFTTAKANWIKFGNTLRLRLLLHYSKLDKAGMVTKMTAAVNAGNFFASNADNFQMPYLTVNGRQNPYHQFELVRANYLFPNAFMVNLMNSKLDPRRAFYFTPFPAPAGSSAPFTTANTGTFVGAKAGDPVSQKYSRMHTYLRGAASGGTANSDGSFDALPPKGITYQGDAPVRMLTFAEYNFIRAEAALYGVPGDAQTFFQAGITASMQAAGVAAADIAAYIATNGTLTGTDAQKLQKIIEEKFVASYGVAEEPWTDWRRTGFPAITKVPNGISDIPRSLPYPQSEIDVNSNAPPQKGSLTERVFWDK